MIRYLTAGESHGKGLTVIIDGVPSNLKIDERELNFILSERQKGYGRGGRQKIENDRVEILSGIRFGKTIGSPVSVFIKNNDYENWKSRMSITPINQSVDEFLIPRPGHADLSGGIRFNHRDLRNVLERASARETAARIIAGAICKILLKEFNIEILGYVVNIAGIATDIDEGLDIKEIIKKVEDDKEKFKVDLRYPDSKKIPHIIKKINSAMKKGDTLGGIIKIIAEGVPPGLGDYTQWDRKLDGKIAMSLMSLQSIKGVEFGAGFSYANYSGSLIHDAIYYSKNKGYYRKTNNAGGIEGGVTNGNKIIIRAVVKPISTLRKGIDSVNIKTKLKSRTVYERSDVCVVPAASVIAENLVAIEITNALMEHIGCVELGLMKKNYKSYLRHIRNY
ncbi:MAG: chorismate synthase [Candidatus Goldbacteria bacterium]|nr:chorismate synthase [Candidatus Goldiibacteriota bacterium]